MNKKQLCTIWLTLLLLTSMVWFPGMWFGYIIKGYPAIRPESMQFIMRILLPLISIALLIIYSLRDKERALKDDPLVKKIRQNKSAIFKSVLILLIGLLVGLSVGYFVLKSHVYTERIVIKESTKTQLQDDDFRDFCKREGYKKEVDVLTNWLKKKQANDVAILYDEDYFYSHDIYNVFSHKLEDERVKIVFSDIFKQGERSFYSRLKIIESLKPEAIIFLGAYEERIAFLEDISHRSELDFWKDRLDRIKWIE